MKRPHLLLVEDAPVAFAPLFRAAAPAAVKVGWLELGEAAPKAIPGPVPESLVQAASEGALRAVAVGPAGSVVVKARGGPPVLDDLLREHFLGCRLVLVRRGAGEAAVLGQTATLLDELPCLVTGENALRVVRAGKPPLELTAEALVACLAGPQPWG